MLVQISRKQELLRLKRDKGELFNLYDMEGIIYKYPNFIGKEPLLQDTRDPLGGSNKTSAEFKTLLEKFKLYLESKVDFDHNIVDQCQKAVNSYKNKARQLKGNSSLMYRRMIHFLSFHVSEFVL